MKHWYWEYVVKDWLVDTEPLQELTRAFWHEALCRMWLQDRIGQLVGSFGQIAKLCRSTTNNARAAIADLQKWNTADIDITVSPSGEEIVTLTNRRMRRAYLDRQFAAKRKADERTRRRENSAPCHGKCHGDVTTTNHSSDGDMQNCHANVTPTVTPMSQHILNTYPHPYPPNPRKRGNGGRKRDGPSRSQREIDNDRAQADALKSVMENSP